jgi:hypothetical protein
MKRAAHLDKSSPALQWQPHPPDSDDPICWRAAAPKGDYEVFDFATRGYSGFNATYVRPKRSDGKISHPIDIANLPTREQAQARCEADYVKRFSR